MLLKRLERIIEIKEKKKEEKEKELKELTELLNITENEIQRTKEEYAKNYSKLFSGLMEGSDFYILKDYLSYLEDREKLLIQKRLYLVKKMDEIKEQLLSIYRELKKLETLKEKALSTKRKEELKALQKKIDEIALRSKEAFV
ncbi:MAG: flagellar export protein FliJ [Deltaproteobacteria bacterium]|nr:flagellar export protein FliJ [Deltaproteobacteria bacterium]